MEQIETLRYSGFSGRSSYRGLLLYFTSFAWTCAFFIFSGLPWMLPLYFVLAYTALCFALITAFRSSHDWLNPLSLIIAIGFIRFSVPGAMIFLGIDPEIPIFDIMGVRRQDWIMGHALALMGLLGLVTGWLLDIKLPTAFIRRLELLTGSRYRALPIATTLCMLLGLLALIVFVESHLSIEDAVYTGEMRQTEIQVGTGKYFYLALMLIASSVVFAAYLSERGTVWWLSIVPAAFAMISYSVLGGRVMALVPIAAAGVVLWYRNEGAKASMKIALILAAGLLPVFFYVGQMYRGGLGVEGVTETFSVSSLIEYTEYALWSEWGNLHSMAAAVMIGPGVLEGRTFSVLFWPFSEFLQFRGQSAGIYMVETLVGIHGDRKWAFHATLIGDAYLNFGLVGVLVATIIFGIVLRLVYSQIRTKLSNTAIYGLAAIYSVRMFYESIEKFPETLLILVFAVFVVQLSRLLTLRP